MSEIDAAKSKCTCEKEIKALKDELATLKKAHAADVSRLDQTIAALSSAVFAKIPSMQTGEASVRGISDNSASREVRFNSAFRKAPRVFFTVTQASHPSVVGGIKLHSVDTERFFLNLPQGLTEMTLNWLAVEE